MAAARSGRQDSRNDIVCVRARARLLCGRRQALSIDCCGLMSVSCWLGRSASLTTETAGFTVCLRAVSVSLRAYWVTFHTRCVNTCTSFTFHALLNAHVFTCESTCSSHSACMCTSRMCSHAQFVTVTEVSAMLEDPQHASLACCFC